jgi:hypothetical protein
MSGRSCRTALVASIMAAMVLPACTADRQPAVTVSTLSELTTPQPAPLGSTRHATVAIPTETGRLPLTYLAGSMAEEDLATLSETTGSVRRRRTDDLLGRS